MLGVKKQSVLVFGDQSINCHAFLADMIQRSRDSLNCCDFLRQANSTLRDEVAALATKSRKGIPSFSTIQELSLRYQKSDASHAAVDGALTCLTQLAHFILISEQISKNDQEPTLLTGLCVGGLAAAAVACEPLPGSIIPFACEAVRIAFRTGLVAQEAALLLDGSDIARNWSFLLPELSVSECAQAIENFNLESNLPTVKFVYISAVANNAVTVSAPPSTLNSLFADNKFFRNQKRIALPIKAPYHASHIHNRQVIASILDASPRSQLLRATKPRQNLLSAASGEILRAENALDLFKDVLSQILCKRLDLGSILIACSQLTAAESNDAINVSGIGPTNVVNSMITSLRAKTGREVDLGIYARQLAEENVPRNLKSRGSTKPKLAIVGMAGRFPSSGDHDKFWDLLMAGIDAHRPIPPDRFDSKLYYDPTSKIRNTSHTPYGNFINDPGMFDPRFFNLSPREAAQTCPMQRLALVTAFEALEMAGYVPNRTPATQLERIGTYYGQTSDDWREINAAQDVDTYFITGGVRAFGPGRINYTFKFSGPSFNIDTACSSSLAAIQIACTALQAGECDTAVAGGVNVLTNPDIFSGLSRGQFLSKTGNCQTFDNDADGYCRGDGIGTVVIKRLEDAEADNDNILAVILGSATNHSAEAISITHPHDKAQEFLYSKILDEAGVDARDVDYVEMHGTGTQAGDDTEMRSVTNVFAPAGAQRRRSDQPLYLGSVKANVGHGEAASGITALIKCLMMLEWNKIPPHVGIKKTMNVNFPKDLAERNVQIALGGARDFLPRTDRERIIYVNNFSAAGGNTGLLLEETPRRQLLEPDPRSSHIIAISAKTKPSLKMNVERLLTWLDRHPATRLEDLSYTLTARRMQHNYRIAITVSSLDQARSELQAAVEKQVSPVQTAKPTVGFVYTGQGSMYVSLGREAFIREPVFRKDILAFDNMATSMGLPTFLPVVDGSLIDVSKASATVSQLAITCTQIAFTRLWQAWGVEPDFVMGHSLGEYAALYACGALSAIDTIYLVGIRAQLLEKICNAGSHAMLSVRAEKCFVKTLPMELSRRLTVSCLNAPHDTVLGSTVENIELTSQQLAAQGTRSTKLEIPYAFHTEQVDPILAPFQEAAKSVTYLKPELPFISTLSASVHTEAISPQYLARQTREPVRFFEALQSGRASGTIDESTIFIEIGPHPVCLSMIKNTLGASYSGGSTLRKTEDFYKTVAATACMLHLRGISVAWNEYHRGFNNNLRLLTLPAYAFDDKNYWLQYTGDWCLNKNAPHPLIKGAAAPEPVKTASPISTTTIHKVIEETVDKNQFTIVTETDASREDMVNLANGHKVNGTVMLSSTVLADMAVTIGNYIEKKHRRSSKPMRCDIGNMTVHRAILCNAKPTEPQIIHCTVKSDLKSQTAHCTFATVKGKTKTQHGHCTIRYGDPEEWKAEWKRVSYLIEGRVKELQAGVATGEIQLIKKRMAYKLFSALVDYSDAYRGMEEVLLNSDDFEATAKVKLVPTPEGESFNLSPHWIDSTSHITGFICNASDAVDSASTVYISAGWQSLRFAEELSPEKTYRSYVRMQPTGQGRLMSGDVYIFDVDTNTIVASGGGVTFSGIPRSLFNTLIPPPVKAVSKAEPVTTAKARTSAKVEVTKTIVPTTPSSGILSRTLEIIAEEMGIDVDELDDPINFAEMGCDSLMSLSITGRMREEMDIDVESHVFTDHPTVGQLTFWMNSTFEAGENEIKAQVRETKVTTTETVTPSRPVPGVLRITLDIIAEEMGIGTDELDDPINFADMGCDSLMSLSITGRMREEMDIDVESHVFVDYPTVGQFKAWIRETFEAGNSNDSTPASGSSSSSDTLGSVPASPSSAPSSHDSEDQRAPSSLDLNKQFKDIKANGTTISVEEPPPTPIQEKAAIVLSRPPRSATSVILQGIPRRAEKTVWILPDGGGSATSYMSIPKLADNIVVYGLNSPYMKTPEEYDQGLVEVTTKFVTEIRRKQPHGPYTLAGWSAGGVVAFEACQQLIAQGEEIEKLVLLDSPCPLIIEPLPSSLHRFFNEIGLLGDGLRDSSKIPAWLLPHFAASVAALSSYTAAQIPAGKSPKTLALWCTDGVCKYPDDPRPDPYPYGHAQWLLENRTDFGPNLWDRFIAKDKMKMVTVPGNHFTMMRSPNVEIMGSLIRDFLLS